MSEASKESPHEEYTAVRDGGAGLLDLSWRARILVSGSDAPMFLNGLVTNDVKTLAMNSWMPAAFANVRGRLIASVRILHREDGFLIDTEEATHQQVFKLLERFTLAGDFRVTDLTETTAQFSVQGKSARDYIAEFDPKTEKLVRQSVLQADAGIYLLAATHTAEDGFDIILEEKGSDYWWNRLLDLGCVHIHEETEETLRIEAGIARYGADMDETTIITETNLDDAVSFTKGCYLGQEIIIRIKHRGHVAKKLAGVVFSHAGAIEPGAKLLSTDDKEVGRLTSATFSPRLGRNIAMGYVKYDYLSPGTDVKIAATDGLIAAEVAELPFIRGSWYQD